MQFYIENGTEEPVEDLEQLEDHIAYLCRTDRDQKWTNQKTGNDWIMYYPMTEIPYLFSNSDGTPCRDQLEETLYNIIKIAILGDMDADLKELPIENHFFTFKGYAIDDEGNPVKYDFIGEDMQALIQAFLSKRGAVLLSLVCHQDQPDQVEHIHGLFYYKPNEPLPKLSRIEEILS